MFFLLQRMVNPNERILGLISIDDIAGVVKKREKEHLKAV